MKSVTQHHQQQRLNPVPNLVVLVPPQYKSLWGLIKTLNMITDTFVNAAGFFTNIELFRLLIEYLAHGKNPITVLLTAMKIEYALYLMSNF